ncbi:MAG: MFS transporter [Betaproteobacteria bacterium]|nr:MFS transporter [Betaproteobacteria bacterium]
MNIERRWRVLAALSLARVGMGFQFQSVAATAPLLSDSLGFDQAQIGWLVGLYLLPGIAFALPGGMLGARFGDKRMVLSGLTLMIAGGLGFAFASDIVQASVARAVMGVGGAVLSVLLTKMVTDWFAGKELVLAMSILVNTWPIGIGIALLTQGALAQSVSWQAAFVATAAMAALGMVSVFFGYTPSPGAPIAQKVDLRRFARQEWILIGATAMPWMLYNAGYVLIVAFLPIYFVHSGLSLVAAGGFTAINTILTIASVQAGGLLVQRYGRANLLVHAGLAGWALATIGLVTSTAPLPWLIAAGLLGGLPAGVLVSLPGEVLHAESRSAGMGIFFTVNYVGMAMAPAIAGVIALRTASSAAPIWMAAACLAAAAGAFAIARWLQKSAAAPRR